MKSGLTLIVLLVFTFGYSQKDISTKLEQYMDAQFAINDFSGTVLVSKNDSVLFKKAYGFADYEWKVKNVIDSKFSLASVSKQFTAVAILQLAENKILSLEDPLSKYFAGFPKGDKITLKMMLTHNSGLNMDFDELYLTKTDLDKDSVYTYLAKKPLLFEPGTSTAYSNIGYYLLARVIEKVSGQSYSAYLKQNVLDKAKMYNSGVSSNDAIVDKMTQRYYFDNDKLVKNPYINWNFNVGHDGVYSTVEDLDLWNKALFESQTLLSEEYKKKMFTSYNEENFGFGVIINPFYNQNHQLIAHDGGFMGAMTSFNKFTDDKILITILSNNQSKSYYIAYGLAGICFGKEVELPYKHIQLAIDPKIYDQYVGDYENIKILKKDNKLYYTDYNIELLPESQTKFFRSDNHNTTLEFIKNKKGKITQIEIKKAGIKEVKNKIKGV
ncbi:Penicillin-binding protein 4* [Flavobacterium bizetiae]|uniref:Penicillin-binding protein 4 n=1 Tax=Flavobacterium bizetiae TaxID=2704140 RepID=A0A6J4GZ05_9FLAO|nr:serine hydrolase [Flavobacterium bizetiae]CAA9203640.1 Penicillin-binding protein 4* [Flavobacterium bizetiae]CAD5342403.1 Penicillin-binding protein 4* [Flavobacterium bizetiae]CAD5348319.1 Penicillin-binding protein 4* [Flavobacterium bizetiae]